MSHDFKNDFQKIIETIEEISGGKVDAIGMGTPGTYDETKQFLISAKNLPELVNVQFVQMLSEKFGCKVFADNDALVASLGEAMYGQGRSGNFMYITWGTGVGGACRSPAPRVAGRGGRRRHGICPLAG